MPRSAAAERSYGAPARFTAGSGEVWLYNPACRRVAEVERVKGLVLHFATALRLADWTFHVSLRRMKDQADCVADPEYRMADLRFNLAIIRPHWLPEMVAHECCHCHVEPLGRLGQMWARRDGARREVVRLAEETLVTSLGQILVAAFPPPTHLVRGPSRYGPQSLRTSAAASASPSVGKAHARRPAP